MGWQCRLLPLFGNDYLYNGKELDTDFGLDWYHYGFRMYDPAIARFTGVDPISDQFPHLSTFNYADNTPINAIDLHGLQAVYVHGTWSNPETWEELRGQNFESIQSATGNNTHIDNFQWSGLNLSSARTEGAEKLVQTILDNANGKEPLTLVGHSHGGNVIIEAVNMLAEQGKLEGLGEVNIVTINTPVREDYQLSEGAAAGTNHINIYDPGDPVQSRGGNDPNQYDDGSRMMGRNSSVAKRKQIVPEGARDMNKMILSGEHGPAGRTFNGATNIKSRRRPVDFHNTHNNSKDWKAKLRTAIKSARTKTP